VRTLNGESTSIAVRLIELKLKSLAGNKLLYKGHGNGGCFIDNQKLGLVQLDGIMRIDVLKSEVIMEIAKIQPIYLDELSMIALGFSPLRWNNVYPNDGTGHIGVS